MIVLINNKGNEENNICVKYKQLYVFLDICFQLFNHNAIFF